MTRSVIVIGAGLSGLTAAYRLQQRGFIVRVLERNDIPGGRMAHRVSGPISYNTGARLIYPFGKELHSLIDEMNLRGDMIALKGLSAECVSDDESYRVKLMPDASALATPGITLAERIRLAISGISLSRLRSKTNPDHAVSAVDIDDRSLADYARDKLGPNVLERMIDPVFRGTRSWNAEDLSAAFYLSTTPHLIGEDTTYSLRSGMGALTSAIAAKLNVTLNAKVNRITIASSSEKSCEVEYEVDGESFTLQSDIVVCATEGAHVGKLIGNPSPEQKRLHESVRYNSLAIVHYALRGELDRSMQFSLRKKSTRIATWQQSPAAKGANGETVAMLYCQLTPEAVKEAIDRNLTQNIDALIRDEIRARIPDFDSRVVHSHNQWIDCKLPTFYPGYLRGVRDFLAWQSVTRQRLYHCGDYLSQALLNGACASGSEVAGLISKHWK